MDFIKSLLLIVSLSSLVLCGNAVRLHLPHHAAVVRPDFLNICKDTENPTLCVKVLVARIQGPLDPLNALQAEIRATEEQAKKTYGIITTLLANPKNSKSLADTLNVCKKQYESMMDSIKKTVGLVATRQISEARFAFSSVISFQQGCADTFEESTDIQFTFAPDSDATFQLAGICLDMMAAMGG